MDKLPMFSAFPCFPFPTVRTFTHLLYPLSLCLHLEFVISYISQCAFREPPNKSFIASVREMLAASAEKTTDFGFNFSVWEVYKDSLDL